MGKMNIERFTEKVQEALAARVAPARLTVPEPAVAVIVAPPQVPLKPFGEQPLGLVRKAALAWIDRTETEGRLAAPLAVRARALFPA